MSDTTDTLENELRRLQPAAPSQALADGIARDLEQPAAAMVKAPPRRAVLRVWTPWAVAAAAACIAIAGWVRVPAHPDGASAGLSDPAATNADSADVATTGDPSAGAANQFIPVSTGNYLFGARDEGLVFLENGAPARKVRLQYYDTVRLRGADDQAAVDVRYPREEVRFVPVAVY